MESITGNHKKWPVHGSSFDMNMLLNIVYVENDKNLDRGSSSFAGTHKIVLGFCMIVLL